MMVVLWVSQLSHIPTHLKLTPTPQVMLLFLSAHVWASLSDFFLFSRACVAAQLTVKLCNPLVISLVCPLELDKPCWLPDKKLFIEKLSTTAGLLQAQIPDRRMKPSKVKESEDKSEDSVYCIPFQTTVFQKIRTVNSRWVPDPVHSGSVFWKCLRGQRTAASSCRCEGSMVTLWAQLGSAGSLLRSLWLWSSEGVSCRHSLALKRLQLS